MGAREKKIRTEKAKRWREGKGRIIKGKENGREGTPQIFTGIDAIPSTGGFASGPQPSPDHLAIALPSQWKFLGPSRPLDHLAIALPLPMEIPWPQPSPDHLAIALPLPMEIARASTDVGPG